MNGVIIYQGKYGATEQYANWCGEELNLLVKKTADLSREQLNKFDFLILGTSVYVGKLQVRKWLKENYDNIKGKKIFLFQVAATPTDEIKKREVYNTKNISPDILQDCEPFYLPGRLVMEKLSWLDRFVLKLGARMTKDKKAKDSMLTDYNAVKKEEIGGIIKAVAHYLNEQL